VLNIDIAPTIMAAAGAEIPAGVQGSDFSALYLTRKAPKWRQEFYYEHPVVNKVSFIPSSEALVTHFNKYIYWPDYQAEEYFDLKKDPFEEKNRIKEQKDQPAIQALKKRMAELKLKAQ
jgi:arylsulfatase A-like enzyme